MLSLAQFCVDLNDPVSSFRFRAAVQGSLEGSQASPVRGIQHGAPPHPRTPGTSPLDCRPCVLGAPLWFLPRHRWLFPCYFADWPCSQALTSRCHHSPMASGMGLEVTTLPVPPELVLGPHTCPFLGLVGALPCPPPCSLPFIMSASPCCHRAF